MPSSLVYKANKINQKFNNIQLSMFPIQWNSNENKWIFGSQNSSRKYIIFSFIWKIVLSTPILLVSLYQMLVNFQAVFKFYHIFVSVIAIMLICGSVVTDFLCLVFGKEVVRSCNWLYQTENYRANILLEKVILSKQLDFSRRNRLIENFNRIRIGIKRIFRLISKVCTYCL